jgi:F-type H+-transporting ATPase subunit epsilon
MEQEKLLDVEIVTPQRVIYNGKAVSVSVPGTQSPFQVLFNHAPIVSTLDIGITKVVDETEKAIFFATSSGFTEIHKNKISILVENAINADEINIEEVRNDLTKAKESLKNDKDSELIKINILEAENKIKTAEKLK